MKTIALGCALAIAAPSGGVLAACDKVVEGQVFGPNDGQPDSRFISISVHRFVPNMGTFGAIIGSYEVMTDGASLPLSFQIELSIADVCPEYVSVRASTYLSKEDSLKQRHRILISGLHGEETFAVGQPATITMRRIGSRF